MASGHPEGGGTQNHFLLTPSAQAPPQEPHPQAHWVPLAHAQGPYPVPLPSHDEPLPGGCGGHVMELSAGQLPQVSPCCQVPPWHTSDSRQAASRLSPQEQATPSTGQEAPFPGETAGHPVGLCPEDPDVPACPAAPELPAPFPGLDVSVPDSSEDELQ